MEPRFLTTSPVQQYQFNEVTLKNQAGIDFYISEKSLLAAAADNH